MTDDGIKYLAYRLEQYEKELPPKNVIRMSDFLERQAKELESNLKSTKAAQAYYRAAKLSAWDEEFNRAIWLADEALRIEPENESYIDFRSSLMDKNFLNKLHIEGIDKKLRAEKWGMYLS